MWFMSVTQALIAAGGKGKRMQNMDMYVPGCKSLFKLQNKPLIFWNVLSLYNAGIKDVIVVCDNKLNLEHLTMYLDELKPLFDSFIYLQDPGFSTTAMIPTWCNKHLHAEFIYTFGHAIFSDSHYRAIIKKKSKNNIVVSEFKNPIKKSRYFFKIDKEEVHLGYPLCIDKKTITKLEENNFSTSKVILNHIENETLERVISVLPIESNIATEMISALSMYDDYIKEKMAKYIYV